LTPEAALASTRSAPTEAARKKGPLRIRKAGAPSSDDVPL
jgi:hypothetical protein